MGPGTPLDMAAQETLEVVLPEVEALEGRQQTGQGGNL